MTTPISASEEAALNRRADTLEEFGQFEATQQIYHGNSLAFDVSHPVPVGHVEKYGYEKNKMVKRIATPEEARRGERTPEPEADPAADAEPAPQPASTRSTSAATAKKGSN